MLKVLLSECSEGNKRTHYWTPEERESFSHSGKKDSLNRVLQLDGKHNFWGSKVPI